MVSLKSAIVTYFNSKPEQWSMYHKNDYRFRKSLISHDNKRCVRFYSILFIDIFS